MNRLFHAAALALMIAALASALAPRRQAAPIDRQAQLVLVLESAGFSLTGARTVFGAAKVYTFTTPNCAEPTDILTIDSVHRDASEAVAAAQRDNSTRQFIYAGEVVENLGSSEITGRWLVRKLKVAFQLAAASPWDSSALAVFHPSNCAIPAIEWSALR